eukprot:scaffold738_cov340-Pavlova_lutheri.AAC.3
MFAIKTFPVLLGSPSPGSAYRRMCSSNHQYKAEKGTSRASVALTPVNWDRTALGSCRADASRVVTAVVRSGALVSFE